MSDEAKIEEAICFARDFLASDFMQNDLLAAPPTEDELLRMGALLMRMDPTEDTNTFDTFLLVGCHMLEHGETIPLWLARFIAGVARGEIKRPTLRGPDKHIHFERDFQLARCVEEVAARFSLPKYYASDTPRKKPAPPKKATAAEIVSRASGLPVEIVITAFKRRPKFHQNQG